MPLTLSSDYHYDIVALHWQKDTVSCLFSKFTW